MASVLAFQPAVTADLVLDKSGPIAFAVTNTGTASATEVTATVRVPRAVTLDPVAAVSVGGRNWTCVTTDQVATCTLATPLAYGDVAPLVLNATANGATSDAVVVEVADGVGAGAAVITSSVSLRLASAGLSVRYQTTSGAFSVAQVGAPLLGCDLRDSECVKDMLSPTGTAQNNNYVMSPLTDIHGTAIDSVAKLDIPAGRQIAFAGLYWSANRDENDGWSGARETIRLRAPNAASFTDVTGSVIAEITDNANRSYYQSFADVTAAVQAGGTGYWAATGAAVSTRSALDKDTYYAGWALVVVYADALTGGNVTVFDGGAWVATNNWTTFAFAAAENRNARFGVVAWDGDRNGGGGGDALKLNTPTNALIPVRWDGSDGSANDAFDSTATGSVFANSLGTDAKPFRSAPLLDGINRLTASTVGDQYLIGVVTLKTTPQTP